MSSETISLNDIDELIKEVLDNYWVLIVYNDNVNTFEHVIKQMIKILKISIEDAIKHAQEVHFTGKSIVKEGTYEELKVFHEQFGEQNITTDVEKI